MRLRFAALVLALLAGLLWSVGPARADAPPTPDLPRAEPWLTLAVQPRFSLSLTSSRGLCTAGTLTEVSWQISSGVPPYRLNVDDLAVDVSADNIRINCGALTEAEAADEEAALAAKRITATVTDSRGVRSEAALEVQRVRALPPLPPATEYDYSVWAHRGELGFRWLAPATPYSCRTPNCFAIRWRAVGSESWAHAALRRNLTERNLAIGIVGGLADGVTYEAAAAAMRDPIELETPEALRWTAPLSGTTLTDPTSLTATATHDTVTVRWNRQPMARFWSVQLLGPDGALGRNVPSWDAATWGDPTSSTHEVVFEDLPSSTNYEVRVDWNVMEGYEATSAKISVRTLPLPAGREPLPRGPQNLRATATHDSITVTWDRPFSGDSSDYIVYLFETEYSLRRRLEYVYSPDSQITFTDLEPDTAYRVVVVHNSIVRAQDEISLVTSEPLLLHLELKSSRELCTAGTLTEISWQISGGSAPYALSIEDSAVDVSAENIRINCGALTEAEAADAEAALAAKTVTAVVTDSRGVRRAAALDVARARALPAPTDFDAAAYRTYILSDWTPAGLSGPGVERSSVLRWRPQGSAQWTFAPSSFMSNVWTPSRDGATVDNLSEATVYELSVADTRTAIESETPEALNWTPVQAVTTLTAATNVRATATHDTITVRWDPQSAPDVSYFVSAHSLKGGISEHVSLSSADPHEFTLRGLPPDTEHRVFVRMEAGDQSRITEAPAPVRTLPAPPDWTAPLRGAQNVRATATHNSITVRWDPPRVDATPLYIVFLFRDHDFIEGQEVKVRHVEVFDATAVRLDGLDSSTAYRVVISHGDAVVRDQEVAISTTASPSSD